MSRYIADAFSQLESLMEDTFELTDTGVEKMKEFEEEPVEDEIVVADLDAEDEIDIEDSYVGKVILDCDVCHSKFYKDKDDVVIDDEVELANVGEECAICGSTNGYKIIGQVCEFCKDDEKFDDSELAMSDKDVARVNEPFTNPDEEEDIIDKDDDEIKVSIDKEKFQESLKKAKMKRLIREKLAQKRKAKSLKESIDDVCYDVADYMVNKFDGKKVITRDEFNDTLFDACDEFDCKDTLEKSIDTDGEFETNVRTVLSYKGYGTDFEGENEGGLTLAEGIFTAPVDTLKNIVGGVFGGVKNLLASDEAEKDTLESKEDKTTPRDRIDARRDDRVERAKRVFDRARDDADSDRDYRLKKDGLKEADKPAAISIEDAQKWVDYDMKRYGKISDRTNRLVRKAGFQIIKDQYGDYEVAVGHYESKCGRDGKELKEAPIYGLRPEYDTRKSFGGKANVEIDGYGTETLYSYDTPVARYTKDGTVELLPKWDYSQTTLRHVKEFLRQHGLKADSLAQIRKDYLKENFERVDIETDREKMSMTAEEDGKVVVTTEPKKERKEEDVIEPVDDETKEEIEDNSIDIDMDEFEEETFDELGESYLKKVYDNVDSYKSTNAVNKGNRVIVEGVIKFNSGKSKKTTFVFESHSATKDNVVKFIGENKEITRGRKAFTLTGKVKDKKFIAESFNYNYRTKDNAGKSQRVYGTIKK